MERTVLSASFPYTLAPYMLTAESQWRQNKVYFCLFACFVLELVHIYTHTPIYTHSSSTKRPAGGCR
eukprot:scaffold402608_cov19-Prasinocladus_malaysianus.AAC.1